jgi:hypothetical protein
MMRDRGPKAPAKLGRTQTNIILSTPRLLSSSVSVSPKEFRDPTPELYLALPTLASGTFLFAVNHLRHASMNNGRTFATERILPSARRQTLR